MPSEPSERGEEQGQSGFSTPSTARVTPATSTDISRSVTPGVSKLADHSIAPTEGNAELEAFRQQWRKEVQSRTAGVSQSEATASTPSADGWSKQIPSGKTAEQSEAAVLSTALPSKEARRTAKAAQSDPDTDQERAAATLSHHDELDRSLIRGEDEEGSYSRPHSPSLASGLMGVPEAAQAPTVWRREPPAAQVDEVEDTITTQKPVAPDLAAARAKRAAGHAKQDAQDLSTSDGQARIEQGIKLYARAVAAEKRGNNSQAIEHYRRAFKLHDDVDRFFQRGVVLLSKDANEHGIAQPTDALLQTKEVSDALALAPPNEDEEDEAVEPSLRARFTPADEEAPSHICSVPDEVLLHVIAQLAAPSGKRGARIPAVPPGEPPSKRGIGVVLAGADWFSVEQLGRASATLRRLTFSQGVWKDIVKATYFPPQLPEPTDHDSLLDMHGGRHWRDVFVHQPRLLLNGVYIASCRYTRQGLNAENRWVNVLHLVEFYRSLRFLPDGRALSLLTTDVPADTVRHGRALSLLTTDVPADTVRRMEPGLRCKGFAIGRWKLMPYGLADDEEEARPPGPKVIIEDLKDRSMDKYCFRVILLLRQTSLGKHNRLDLLDYASVNLRTAEVSTLMNASHKLSFSFSVVRSYGI
ncbi:F-box protein FBX9 [Ceraceosorus bombacis]|uniref:F-box protein FBX9 n=1 Tax=Ceraceosorus bombacis TaxID=401625 RepID=A0A0N7LAS4_9BASI|nr:F-box protein FBX9 [Ceraceosorus bombacis]